MKPRLCFIRRVFMHIVWWRWDLLCVDEWCKFVCACLYFYCLKMPFTAERVLSMFIGNGGDCEMPLQLNRASRIAYTCTAPLISQMMYAWHRVSILCDVCTLINSEGTMYLADMPCLVCFGINLRLIHIDDSNALQKIDAFQMRTNTVYRLWKIYFHICKRREENFYRFIIKECLTLLLYYYL